MAEIGRKSSVPSLSLSLSLSLYLYLSLSHSLAPLSFPRPPLSFSLNTLLFVCFASQPAEHPCALLLRCLLSKHVLVHLSEFPVQWGGKVGEEQKYRLVLKYYSGGKGIEAKMSYSLISAILILVSAFTYQNWKPHHKVWLPMGPTNLRMLHFVWNIFVFPEKSCTEKNENAQPRKRHDQKMMHPANGCL